MRLRMKRTGRKADRGEAGLMLKYPRTDATWSLKEETVSDASVINAADGRENVGELCEQDGFDVDEAIGIFH